METQVASWPRTQALNALAWWVDAGIDTIVSDEPCSWLQMPAIADQPVQPADVEKSENKLIYDNGQSASLAVNNSRIQIAGDPTSPIILVLDAGFDGHEINMLPDTESRLFSKMMAAIGLSLDQVIRIGLPSALSPASAREQMEAFPGESMLLLGDGPCKALLGAPAGQARGRVHEFQLGTRKVPVVATFSPRFLMQQPRMKALAWADLLSFAKILPR